MKTTQALFLAGLAVMSLGAGAANAQSLTPSSMEGPWYASQNRAAVTTGVAPTQPALPQSGASDEGKPLSWLDSGWAGDHNPYRFQYGDLGGGGSGG